jgi:hypothetical protein
MTRISLFRLFGFLVVALATVNPAIAQGVGDALPDPISRRDLDRYAAQLGLTLDQRAALEPFHREYLQSFRLVREAEAGAWPGEGTGDADQGSAGLDRDAIEKALKKLERTTARIRLLDEQFFDRVQSVLVEDQQVRLPRVIQGRRRQRYESSGMRVIGDINPAACVDVARLAEDLELTGPQREAVEPFIVEYETRFTVRAGELYQAMTRLSLEVFDQLAARGVGFDDPAELLGRQDLVSAMDEVWGEAIKKPRDAAAAMSRYNRQTVRSIEEVLPPSAARRLRSRYVRAAYPEIPAPAAVRVFRMALELESLTASLREDLLAASAEYAASRDSIVEKMVGYLDGFRRDWSPDALTDDGRGAHEEALASYRQQLAAADLAALETLEGLLGPRHAGMVRHELAAAREPGPAPADGLGWSDGGGPDESIGNVPPALRPDPFLPPPLSAEDVAGYAGRLNLDEDGRLILETIHDEYLTEFNRVRATDLAALRRARVEAGGSGQISSERIAQIYDLRARVLSSIRALDASFFDDLETLVAPPESVAVVRRLRAAREREVYRCGIDRDAMAVLRGETEEARPGGTGDRSLEYTVDLAELVEALDLVASERDRVDRALAVYEAKAAEGFRLQRERVVEACLAAETLRARLAAVPPDDESGGLRARLQASAELRRNHAEPVRDARKLTVTLNRETLETVAQALREPAIEALRESYRRAAYPHLFDEPRLAERYLAAALDLPDLDVEQRRQIERIQGQYLPRERELVRDLAIVLAARADDEGGLGGGRWKRVLQYSERIEVLEAERLEVNEAALRQLREVLRSVQALRLRLPPAVAAQDRGAGTPNEG